MKTNKALENFVNGKTDLKTAEDEFIRMLNDMVEVMCTAPRTELTFYATKETLGKFKKIIPPEIKTCEIPSSVDAEPFKDKIIIIPIKDDKPLKIVFERD